MVSPRRVARVALGVALAALLMGWERPESVVAGATGEARPPMSSKFDDHPPEGPPRQQTSEEEVEREDTAAIAEAQGWTFEEARHRLRFDEEFSEFVVRLRRNYLDTVAAIWQEDGEHDTVFFVRFVGPIPEAARAWAEELGLEINFMDDGTSSEQELHRRARAINERVSARGFENMASAAVPRLGRIELEITRPEGYRGGQRDDELRERLPRSARASDVIVRFYDDPVVVSEAAGPDARAGRPFPGAWVGQPFDVTPLANR